MHPNTHRIIRAVTVSQSLGFCREVMREMREKGYEMVAVSSPGEELERLQKVDGFHYVAVPMERRMAPLKDLRSLWRLIKVFRAERPQMVHSMTPKAGLLCMLAAWITRVPRRVHTFTGLVWPTATGLQRRILMLTDWLTCACATHVIPEGRGVMRDLQQITHKPMRVLGYGNVRGVDMKYWCRENVDVERVKRLRAEDAFTFVFVGRIVRDKGIDELVEAFVQVRQEHRVRLVIVGRREDELDPVSEKTRMLMETCADIVCVGPKHGKDLLAQYAAADCFVLPSYREGFPNTVLEAGAMGLPSIVTNINGSSEIVENGRNGLIVPPKDVRSLAEAMVRMMTDDDMREQMMARARQMIESRFEKGYVMKCMLDFYEEILY